MSSPFPTNPSLEQVTSPGKKRIDMEKEDESVRDPSYFHYYSQLTHQQNMLQDTVRTSTYHKAILSNPHLYQNKVVMDVGAGSGILSYFAVQAGASVIAVEASNMALKMLKILRAASHPTEPKNTFLKDKLKVICSKIEDVKMPPNSVDTIVSEPIGVLLVHERMIESFLYARDNFLKPGGTMVPSQGTIYLAPFTDQALWLETKVKSRFWESNNFFDMDLSPLAKDAVDESFSMPVVGYFDPNTLLSPPSPGGFGMDFQTVTMDELKKFEIPFTFMCSYTGVVHGIATWFDLHFHSNQGINIDMSTSPFAERTHWMQTRLLFQEPLAVNAGTLIQGTLYFEVNSMRSYNISGTMSTMFNGQPITTRSGKWDLQEQSYNYSYQGPIPNAKPELLGLYEPSSN